MSLDLTGLTYAQGILFVVRYVRRVQHLMTDPRSIAALDVAERYAKGEATRAEMFDASDAAWFVRPEEVAQEALAARAAAFASSVGCWAKTACFTNYALWAIEEAVSAALAQADAARAAARTAELEAERAEQQRILDEIRKEVQP